MKRLIPLIAILALVPVVIGACNGDDNDAVPDVDTPEIEEPDVEAPDVGDEVDINGEQTTLQVTADPDGGLAYVEDSLEAPAGEITIEFDNPSTVPHDVVIEDQDGTELARTDVITDASDSTSVELEPGDYTFFCSVPGHREAGQEGPLTVTED